MRLSVGEGEEAGSTRIAPIPKARAHAMHAPSEYECGQASNRSISVEPSSSVECPHPKE